MTEQPVPSRDARQADPGLRRLAAITVATSLLVWWPAFTLGVYDEIFFEQLFALWAASTTAFFVAVLLLGRRAQPEVYSLLIPSVWIALTWLTPADTTGLGHDVLVGLGVLVHDRQRIVSLSLCLVAASASFPGSGWAGAWLGAPKVRSP